MPALSFKHAKTLCVVAALGVAPIFTSCKRGPTREQREITEHFDKPKREEEDLNKKITDYFKDTPYTIRASNTLMGGSLKEGTVTKEDLLKLEFSLLIICYNAPASEDRKIIDQGLRSILTWNQYQTAKVVYSEAPPYGTGQSNSRPPTSPSSPTPSESLPASEAPRPE